MASSLLSRSHTSAFQPKHFLFLIFALMGIFVFFNKDIALFQSGSALRHRYSVIPLLMFAHGVPGALALLLAPFQFSTRLRRRYLSVHRIIGRIYVGCVAIAAPTAVAVSFTLSPNITHMAAVVQALGWISTTAMGLYCVRTGRIKQHREWMFRSYPFAMVFVFVRAINGIPAIRELGTDARPSVVWTMIALAGFLPSFILAFQAMKAEKSSARVAARA